MLIAGEKAAEQRPVVAHSASYGLDRPKTVQAPAGADENRLRFRPNLSPLPGLINILSHIYPRLSPWATVARRSAALSMPPTLCHTHSPIY